MEEILRCVCEANGLVRDDMMIKNRSYEYISDARYMLYSIARKIDSRTYSIRYIADFVSRKHSSILWGLRKHELKYENDKYYRKCYDESLSLYEDWSNGFITESKEEEIDTPFGKRKAILTTKYNKYE